MTPWRLYAKLATAAALVLVIGLAYLQGRSDGSNLARGEFAAIRAQEANEANTAIAGITLRYRGKEQRWAQQSAAISKTYQIERANHETTKLAALAAVDAGTLKLRLTDSDCKAPGNLAASPAASPTGNNDPSESRFLGKADSAFLIAEAGRADAIVSQLTACQALIIEDRVTATSQ